MENFSFRITPHPSYEEYVRSGKPALRPGEVVRGMFGAFDIDGNLVFISQTIWVERHGKEEPVNPSDWREVEPLAKAGERGYRLLPKGRMFQEFNHPEAFKKAFRAARPGPAWADFVRLVNSAGLIFINTARGLPPATIVEAIREAIFARKDGLDPELCAAAQFEYLVMTGRCAREDREKFTTETLVDSYLGVVEGNIFSLDYPPIRESLLTQEEKEGKVPMPETHVLKARADDRIHEIANHYAGMVLYSGETGVNGMSEDTRRNVAELVGAAERRKGKPSRVEHRVYDTSSGAKELVALVPATVAETLGGR